MTEDSIRRGLALLFATALTMVGHKLGLSDGLIMTLNGLFGLYIAQSAAKAIAGGLAKHKAVADALGAAVSAASDLKAAYDKAKAETAQAAGEGAAQAPGSPSQG